MERTTSATALDEWCNAERGRAAGLAAVLKVSATTINHYRRGVITPASKPGDDKQRAIEEHTGGVVPAGGWVASSATPDSDEHVAAPSSATATAIDGTPNARSHAA